MELRNINSFLKLAEVLSFSKTAELLGYSQSNITMQMKQLETELGIQLFDRIGKSVQLTQEGKIFRQYALEAVNSLETGIAALSKEPQPCGELRIGLLESLCITYLPELITSYHQQYPLVNTIIKIGTVEQLERMLNHNEIDLMWIYNPLQQYPDWNNAFTYPNPIHIIASPESPYRGRQLKLCDLQNETFILTESNCSYRNCFSTIMRQKEVSYQLFLEIGNTEIIKRFVVSGIALSILPEFTIQHEIRNNLIISLDVEDFQVTMYGQVFYHKRKMFTPAMQTFIESIKQVFS
ncbi:LysR family transcriptional regulator [Anaerosporobacter faecicola]|uniref:LysR family transcriptional regulator n=1 Tax=Anaerosporobacter faecicola TaxID=2718714 RepID=UPI00143B58D2|nr:LysR family transcriptional regulator [Anaerosporobacter faecicola]